MLDQRTKQIWRRLVDYANALDVESGGGALRDLASLLSECIPWMARTEYMDDVPAMLAVHLNPGALWATIKGRQEPSWMCLKSEQELMDQFRQQALEYQPQVRTLLTWLCDPNQAAEARPLAFHFLLDHTKHIEFQRGDPAYAPKDEESHFGTPVKQWTLDGKPKSPTFELKDDFPHRTLTYEDIADPICDFIHREHEAHREPPIRICKRPGCGNLVAQFKKKEFCRTGLCDAERQKRDGDVQLRKNRDRVAIYRLNHRPVAVRRAEVRDKADYLREIVAYWQESNHANPTLVKQALDLLKLAGNKPDAAPGSTPTTRSVKG
jgi:hypothetical protein